MVPLTETPAEHTRNSKDQLRQPDGVGAGAKLQGHERPCFRVNRLHTNVIRGR